VAFYILKGMPLQSNTPHLAHHEVRFLSEKQLFLLVKMKEMSPQNTKSDNLSSCFYVE